jgi:hypothetical protein
MAAIYVERALGTKGCLIQTSGVVALTSTVAVETVSTYATADRYFL